MQWILTGLYKLSAMLGVMMALQGASVTALADDHKKRPTVPCDIKLIFDTDKNGMSVAAYKLEMQITNRQGRPVTGMSVYWLNENKDIIGNSDTVCGADEAGIGLSQSGPCRRTVQQVNSRLLDRLGQHTWTDLINSEMRNFRLVQHCAIIGYKFGNHAVKRY